MAQTLMETISNESSTSETKSSRQSLKEGTRVKRALKFPVLEANNSQDSAKGTINPIEDSQSTALHNSSTSVNFTINRIQPTKCFLTRCHSELETLLSLIKDSFHQEIKNLWNGDDLYTDLIILIGKDFKKPVHKCIFASRAFKLFNTLKAFASLQHNLIEKDIIISEFQDHSQDSIKKPIKESIDTEQVQEELDYELLISKLELPTGLISPELFLNFLRRVYLDQDLVEEENKLNQQCIDWLKLTQPNLFRSHVKHTPDHKESFRTIQPDLEKLTISSDSAKMPSGEGEQLIGETSGPGISAEVSQPTSATDEGPGNSLLTRTETFELITKGSRDGSTASPTSKIDDQIGLTPSGSRSDEGELSSSEASSIPITPYAPTTRTGLKPKTFTTPINMRITRNSTPSSTNSSGSQAPKPAKEKPLVNNTSSSTKTSASTPVASKRSSLTANLNCSKNDSQDPAKQNASSRIKTPTAIASTGKGSKLSTITRAQPISLERSQSPATNVIKGSGRNFIAANKRLIAQLEKKANTLNDQVATSETEAEVSDAHSYILESLTHDNLVAQLDKLTLISQSKLAESLSQLFIDGNLADTIILTKDGKQIKAHKCILAARSAYLTELISNQTATLAPDVTVDEANNANQKLKVDLSEFSYSAVYFSIIHIYSGFAKVPDDVDIDELMKLSHLLHITTLRHVCVHTLRMNYCHYFHKPCNVCCLGVLKTLPLAWRYDFTELYSKCLQWIGSHFASIFCLREFSELKPHDLLEECYAATLSQLTPENIIPKTIECQKLLKNLPRVKWTESVICLVGRQLEDFCHYVADNYEKILQSESFLNLGKNCWECEVLEENLLAAMNHLKPDSGCKTLIQLHAIECSIESYTDEARSVSDSFANLVSKMRKYCERYLLKDAAAVVHCNTWRHMNPSLQKRIKDQAIITTDFDEATKQLTPKPKLPSMCRVTINQQSTNCNSSSSDGISSPSNRSTPETRIKSPSTTYLPPPKSKIAAARHVKVLK